MFPRVEIRTERLLQRPWRLTDVDEAFAYAADPEWGMYLWNTPYPYTRDHAAAFVRMAAEDDWSRQALRALELDGAVVGGIRLYITDATAMVAGMRYNLARLHWGEGPRTDAASAALAYAFNKGNLHKVMSTAGARNVCLYPGDAEAGYAVGGHTR